MSKVLLITGATGKQGGATVDALIASPRAAEFKILCLTRDPSSPSAEKLINKGNTVKLLKGDLANCDKIFKDAHRQEGSSIWGVFSVQV